MNSVAELKLHTYLEKAGKGLAGMSDDTIEMVVSHIRDALKKQFSREEDNTFRLRMSNIGRPYCQLWFQKNKPDKKVESPKRILNFMLGDIVEAVFKGVLTEAGVDFEDSKEVKLKLGKSNIKGTYDLVVDGAVDDIKSASDWSYKYKFESFDSLAEGDSFGYIGQLTGYALASDSKIGGWWVVNKTNGNFKYVPATNVNVEKELSKIKDNIKRVDNKELVRCFSPEPEYFRGKPTGNNILSKNCTFCDFRQACWETLETLPAKMSKAKEPKMVHYVNIKKEKNI